MRRYTLSNLSTFRRHRSLVEWIHEKCILHKWDMLRIPGCCLCPNRPVLALRHSNAVECRIAYHIHHCTAWACPSHENRVGRSRKSTKWKDWNDAINLTNRPTLCYQWQFQDQHWFCQRDGVLGALAWRNADVKLRNGSTGRRPPAVVAIRGEWTTFMVLSCSQNIEWSRLLFLMPIYSCLHNWLQWIRHTWRPHG